MKLIEYQGIVKYPLYPDRVMYERWTKDDEGNVIRHTSYDLETWEPSFTPYKEIPVFIINRKEDLK